MKSYKEWKIQQEMLHGMGGENPPISTSAARPADNKAELKKQPKNLKPNTYVR